MLKHCQQYVNSCQKLACLQCVRTCLQHFIEKIKNIFEKKISSFSKIFQTFRQPTQLFHASCMEQLKCVNCKPSKNPNIPIFIVLHILQQQDKGFSCHDSLFWDVKNLLSFAALQVFPLHLGSMGCKMDFQQGKHFLLSPNIVHSCHVITLCFQIKEINLFHGRIIFSCDIFLYILLHNLSGSTQCDRGKPIFFSGGGV